MGPAQDLAYGAYVLQREEEDSQLKVILMATGSEVPIALEALKKLKEKGVSARVVSMPSWELFDQQPQEYRDRILPPGIQARVAIEAGRTQGWYRYVGERGVIIGLVLFGASAPYKILYEKFGLTVDKVVKKVLALLIKG